MKNAGTLACESMNSSGIQSLHENFQTYNTVSSEMFVRTYFSLIFVNLMTHEFKVFANKMLKQGFRNAQVPSHDFKNSLVNLK